MRRREVRLTTRLDTEMYERAKKIAKARGWSAQSTMNYMLVDATGIHLMYPCIVKTGDDYLWISPAGMYGTLNRLSWQRFLAGGTPLEGDGQWTDGFEEMDEAVNSLGTEVCRQSIDGIRVIDLEAFLQIAQRYHHK